MDKTVMVIISKEYFDYLVKVEQDYITTISNECVKHINKTLYDEIEEDKIKPIEVKSQATSNPFNKVKRGSYHSWSKQDYNSMNYCANTKIASHNTLDYLKRKLPLNISESAIRKKLSMLGYKIKKGRICKK